MPYFFVDVVVYIIVPLTLTVKMERHRIIINYSRNRTRNDIMLVRQRVKEKRRRYIVNSVNDTQEIPFHAASMRCLCDHLENQTLK